jgi:two-component system sensor histidine kinase PilS (NtrC family)
VVIERTDTEQEEIRKKLKWLMSLRVMIVTILMGGSIALKVGQSAQIGSFSIFYFLIAFTYLLTILYGLVLKHIRALTLFTYCQIAVDIGLETSLVAATRGLASPFTFLYLISIISSSMILYRRGGIAAALASSILYGMAGGLQYYGIIQFGAEVLQPREAIYSLLINIVAFFTVAILSSNLAEKLKQTRQSLHEKETGLTELKAFHENIVQSISSGLLTADLAGRVTSFNRAAQEITGLSWEEVKGRRCVEVFPWKGLQEFYDDPLKIYRSSRHDVETKRNDGSRLLLGVTLSSLRDEQGRVAGVVGTFQDLTKIRELEEEMRKQEKMASIGEMAAGMAHEIRNPLAALSGSMQVLRKELVLNDEHQHLMEIALKETYRLNNIITEFLYYARPSPPNYKSCDLNRLLGETLQLLQNSKDYHKGIQIRTAFGREPILVKVDPDQMKQVFWNLSINAVQAMSAGGVLTVTVAVRNMEEDGAFYRLRVPGWTGEKNHIHYCTEIIFEDSGSGIRREHLYRIFDPFFTTKSHGSGLGLAIVHRIIEDHGGRVWAESKAEKGARFTIQLPAELVAGR